MKLNTKALALALGTIWGAYVFLLGFVSLFGWGVDLVEVLSKLYIGFAPTIFGTFVGGVWGFADGFIAGVIIAWIYNSIAKKYR